MEVYVDIQKDLKLVKVQRKETVDFSPCRDHLHHTTHSQGSCITAEEEAEMQEPNEEYDYRETEFYRADRTETLRNSQ